MRTQAKPNEEPRMVLYVDDPVLCIDDVIRNYSLPQCPRCLNLPTYDLRICPYCGQPLLYPWGEGEESDVQG